MKLIHENIHKKRMNGSYLQYTLNLDRPFYLYTFIDKFHVPYHFRCLGVSSPSYLNPPYRSILSFCGPLPLPVLRVQTVDLEYSTEKDICVKNKLDSIPIDVQELV